VAQSKLRVLSSEQVMTFSPDGGLKNSKDGREKETGVS